MKCYNNNKNDLLSSTLTLSNFDSNIRKENKIEEMCRHYLFMI